MFYYLIQDLRVSSANPMHEKLRIHLFFQCMIFSLISLHFKIKPI